jgi:hypothetical protein
MRPLSFSVTFALRGVPSVMQLQSPEEVFIG